MLHEMEYILKVVLRMSVDLVFVEDVNYYTFRTVYT